MNNFEKKGSIKQAGWSFTLWFTVYIYSKRILSDHIWLKKSMKEMNYIFYRGPIWTFWTSQKNTYYMHEFEFFLQNYSIKLILVAILVGKSGGKYFLWTFGKMIHPIAQPKSCCNIKHKQQCTLSTDAVSYENAVQSVQCPCDPKIDDFFFYGKK